MSKTSPRRMGALRDQLLQCETFTPGLREKYLKEVEAMLTVKLTPWKKVQWILAAIMGLGFVILFGTVAAMVPSDFPPLGRIAFIVGAVFGAAWLVLSVTILRRGEMDLRKTTLATAGLGWGFIVIMMTIFLYLGSEMPDRLAGVQLVLFGMVFFVGGAVQLIVARIDRAELNTREKLLQVEYRLAELSEQVGKGQEAEPPGPQV